VRRPSKTQHAFRVLELAARVSIRAARDSTSSITTGRLAKELEDYVKRLRRLKEEEKPNEFFKVLRNAQAKLAKLVCALLR
jgi:hypothetical protein